MSTNVSEVVVQRGKLLVHLAQNGRSFELDCHECTLVEAIQRYLESSTGVHINDQLLLCMDLKLEPQRPLSAYKLPSEDREVFLFNRARMRTNSNPPAMEKVEIPEISNPPSPSSSNNPHPLDDAPDPAMKALASYERQFRYHYQCGRTIYNHTQAKLESCARLLNEQKVQERALEVARDNLDHYYKIIVQKYMDFMKCYSKKHQSHSSLLVNAGRDLEKLRSCKLLPALQSNSRKCLLDFVKDENLRKVVDDCSSSHRQFENKVVEFKLEFGELKQSAELLFTSKASDLVKDLEAKMKEHQRYVNEQKSIMQALSKDVNTVKKLVDDCLSSQLSSSLRPHDAVSALGPIYEGHDKNYLPNMGACDHAISNLLVICTDKKNDMNTFVHNYMQKIAYTQSKIKDVHCKFPVFSEALKRQNDQFEYLKVIHGIGPAYRACLAEIVRRKASMKLYMGMAGQLAEKLATTREAEMRRREEFVKVHSSCIPRDVLGAMGLYDTPSQCDVNISPFDTNLLDIEVSDIDRFAPEHLVGVLSKSGKYGSLKGSSSMSSDSPQSAEVDDGAVDPSEKYDLEELFDGSVFVGISGTSKLEVENAKLKSELASAIALICSLGPEIEFELLDESKVDSLLKNAADKTAEALHLKDEYGKHLLSMLKAKHKQCESYEKRIQELEQRLSDQYMQRPQLSVDKTVSTVAFSTMNPGDSKSGISGDADIHAACVSGEPMDDISGSCDSLLRNPGLFPKSSEKASEGLDENMIDSPPVENVQLDLSMLELPRDINGQKVKDVLGTSCSAGSLSPREKRLPTEIELDQGLDSKGSNDLILVLQSALAEKSSELSETEIKLKGVSEDLSKLERELEMSRKLLDESQMNCAHLENALHEAREAAQTHLCAADRRASEYKALRASAVKMRSLFERLRTCVSSGSVTVFVESLRALAQSLSNSVVSDKEDDGTADFRECIRVLTDKVGLLSRQRADLLERYSKAETASEQLKKELEEKKELINTLYVKHQHEKQANKEKISIGCLLVHEIAAFVLNSSGHYQAINRNCPNYYLSAESVALFVDHLPKRPAYVIGQIVHIERQTVRHPSSRASSVLTGNSNPYGLPIGCEYFVVTVAMLPDNTVRSLPPS